MSQKKLQAIEDYLLGRIAALDDLVREYGEGDLRKLQMTRAALMETRLTLKKMREITKGK